MPLGMRTTTCSKSVEPQDLQVKPVAILDEYTARQEQAWTVKVRCRPVRAKPVATMA